MLKAFLAGAALALTMTGAARAQGIFPGGADIGDIQPGTTKYDKATQTYQITGGGADMWGTSDGFHLAWQQVTGDWAVTASVKFPPGSHPPNEKAVLIFRESLDPDSPYVDVAIHADGHITLQWRTAQGAVTADSTAPVSNATLLRIERHGNHYVGMTAGSDGQFHEFASKDVSLKEPLYVGVGVCAHDASRGLATIEFSHVKVELLPMAASTGGR
jgi:TolB protein